MLLINTPKNNKMRNLENVHYAVATFSGSGHYKIEVELMDDYCNYKKFSATTTNMRAIDESKEIEGQEKDDFLYSIIENQIDDQVQEWLQSEI